MNAVDSTRASAIQQWSELARIGRLVHLTVVGCLLHPTPVNVAKAAEQFQTLANETRKVGAVLDHCVEEAAQTRAVSPFDHSLCARRVGAMATTGTHSRPEEAIMSSNTSRKAPRGAFRTGETHHAT